MKAVAAGTHPIPLSGILGFTVTAAGGGTSEIVMDVAAEHANPAGTLHGGVLCTLADSAMGVAHWSTLSNGEVSTTLELKINFLRPFWAGRLRTLGKVTNAGKTISLVEADVFDDRNRLIARASSTCMTLRGAQAEGRMPPQV